MKLKNMIPALLLVGTIAQAKENKEERNPAQTGHVGSFSISVPVLQIPCKIEELKLNASGNYETQAASDGPITISYGTYWSDRSVNGWVSSAYMVRGDYLMVTATQVADTSKALKNADQKGMAEFKVLKSLSLVIATKKAAHGQSFTTTDADGKAVTANRLTCTFEK